MEILQGKNVVLEALRAGQPLREVLLDRTLRRDQVITEIFTLAKSSGIQVYWSDKKNLNCLSKGERHQGAVAQLAGRQYLALEDILEVAEKKGEQPFLLLLDGIEDPHNLGAIIRTADCSGVHGAVIPKRRAVGLTPTVSRTSAGATAYLPVAREANINNVIRSLKEKNVWVVGVEASAKKAYTEADFTMPVALVIGSEGEGLAEQVKKNCDFLISIPMYGHVNSLNASVAAAIVMYEVVRQRKG
ncbi:MAG: 23S rRNA (guanosine(2251)-2'-O)-methyltransferase RlmB [Candidatus Saganbacteria bacterium]|nr:23S rRNA (guanosine(2251)-2'-O)-methyltransferase RlmB [Candidatus Saganbacteria bacterium]